MTQLTEEARRLLKLAEKATPGPWRGRDFTPGQAPTARVRTMGRRQIAQTAPTLSAASQEDCDNAEFIAAARELAPALADAYLAREKTTQRLLFIAEHLFQMVPREVWRDSGGDDGQGYYEGDYRAEGLREELSTLRAAVSAGSPETGKD